MSKASKLIKDLDNVADIVGQLGLSVAGAQRAFNLEYVEALRQISILARSMLGDGAVNDDNTREFLNGVLTRLAPPLLRYTETSIEVRLDLAQSIEMSGSATVGVNVGAVSVGASFAAAYGLDYRAAAVVRAVIHAKDLDTAAMGKLLARAKDLNASGLSLPAGVTFDKEFQTGLHGLSKNLGGTPADVTEEKPEDGTE